MSGESWAEVIDWIRERTSEDPLAWTVIALFASDPHLAEEAEEHGLEVFYRRSEPEATFEHPDKNPYWEISVRIKPQGG